MTDQPPQPQEPGVLPSPVPTSFGVGSIPTDDGNQLVVLQAQTPVGNAVYFLEPGTAVQVGNALRAQGKASASKLSVPRANGSGLIVPG